MSKNLLPYLVQFSNEDFKIAFERVCSRLEGEEFTVADVQQSYNNAIAYIRELKVLRSDKGPHPLTESITKKRDVRHNSLLSIKGRVNYYLKSPLETERKAAKLMITWMNRFSKNFRRPSINKQTEMVNNMMLDLSASKNLAAAVNTLKLSGSFDFIASVTTEMLKEHAAREREKVAKKLQAKEVRREAYQKMKTLRISMEIAIILEQGDADLHLEHLRIINLAMADFKSLFLNSKTRQKNATLETEKEDVVAKPEKEIVVVKPKESEQIDATKKSGETSRVVQLIPLKKVMPHKDFEMPAKEAAMQSKATTGDVIYTIPLNSNLEHDTTTKPKIEIDKFAVNPPNRASRNKCPDS